MKTRKKKLLVTVDWDYHIPEKIEWDMGHREAAFFLTVIWGLRGQLIDQMKTTGEEIDFWDKLHSKLNFKVDSVVVTDSHGSVIDLATKFDDVLLFDAHHDCWKIVDFSLKSVQCHDWGTAWAVSGMRNKMWWVCPDWQDKSLIIDGVDKMSEENLVTLSFAEFMKKDWSDYEVTACHICRSGCWTPPWLDEEFQNFVNKSNFGHVCPDSAPWDGWLPRWSEGDAEAAKKMYQDMRTMTPTAKRICNDNGS